VIHGAALQQPEALEIELEGIQARLAMLSRLELDVELEDTRLRTQVAIKIHQRRAEDIEQIMQQRHWIRHLPSARSCGGRVPPAHTAPLRRFAAIPAHQRERYTRFASVPFPLVLNRILSSLTVYRT